MDCLMRYTKLNDKFKNERAVIKFYLILFYTKKKCVRRQIEDQRFINENIIIYNIY